MTLRQRLVTPLVVLCLGWANAPAQADPFRPGADLLRVSFNDIGAYAGGYPLESLDVFEFAVGVGPLEPITSYTARLFDRGRLLGTYTGANPATDPGPGLAGTAPFMSTTSVYTLRNPTVIDFGSFNDGSFDGFVEFTIEGSRPVNVFQFSSGLQLGRADGPSSQAFAFDVNPTSFVIEPIPDSAPIPEPASVVLLLTGAGIAVRRCVRRSTRA